MKATNFGLLTALTFPLWFSSVMQTTIYSHYKEQYSEVEKGRIGLYYDRINKCVWEDKLEAPFSSNIYYDTNNDGALDSCIQTTTVKVMGRFTTGTTTIKKNPALFKEPNEYYRDYLKNK